MNEAEKQVVIAALRNRLMRIECPMCHHNQFTLVEGSFANVIQEELPKIKIDGKYIPSISIVCNHCGFISQHAARILNVMKSIIREDSISNNENESELKTE